MKRGSIPLMRATIGATALLLAGGVANAQPYDGPPTTMTTYWDVPAFKDMPYKGQAAAKGVLFWSHGVAGQLEQYGHPVPEFIKDFARDGWDVVKIQRNNLHEHGWSASGTRHVADLVERIQKAHAQGYKRIVAAGQSYGGAISIEAAKRTDLLFGVIATGPGHGSDACGARAGFSSARIADNLQRQLAGAIEGGKATRVILVMAAKDECQGYNNPTAQIRAALERNAAPFVFLDDGMPVHGHGAASTNQFRVWYARCLLAFLDPGRQQPAKEHVCAGPGSTPRFLFPADFQMPRASAGSLVGGWSGALAASKASGADGQEICIVIREARAGELVGGIAFGAGPERKISMTWNARSWKRDGERFVYAAPGSSYAITLQPQADARLAATITAANGAMTWSAALQPGC